VRKRIEEKGKMMIEIDGGQGEGGGQILRTALSLSLITGQAFDLYNIRAKRPKPGLMRQHLACVQAAQHIAPGATALGEQGEPVGVGSARLRFTPAPVVAGNYEVKVGSAGSCMLVLQTVMWPLLLAEGESRIQLQGGTHNPMAPSATYLQYLAKVLCGGRQAVTLELKRHGFYPAGGGEVHVTLQPMQKPWPVYELMHRGELVSAHAECLHAGIARNVAQRELQVLLDGLGWPEDRLISRELPRNEGPGNALMTVLEFEHITEVIDAYGAKGVTAEEVADRVLKKTLKYLDQTEPVGEYLADQLMLPMALSCMHGNEGRYWATGLSQHARTNAEIIQRFLPVRFGFESMGEGVLVRVVAG
jgi:RNA 3'-terminal phosphate cyclase (ATP)